MGCLFVCLFFEIKRTQSGSVCFIFSNQEEQTNNSMLQQTNINKNISAWSGYYYETQLIIFDF